MNNTRTPKEYSLDVYSDLITVKDVIKGTVNSLDQNPSFPFSDASVPELDVELHTLVDSRVNAVAQQYLSIASETPRGPGGRTVRGKIAVEFFERRRKRIGGGDGGGCGGGGGGGGGGVGVWFPGFAGQGGEREEEDCWERWILDVTVATPRTEA
ncbi:hypothetical protein KEM54_000507, partial [Ascosphaera aggregata]